MPSNVKPDLFQMSCRGREATSEALCRAFEHQEKLARMSNPVGFLYRVGQSRSRVRLRRPISERPVVEDPWVEPRLMSALAEQTFVNFRVT
jgi:DNA-directed RNA polymerase specialized sigma24 family protein